MAKSKLNVSQTLAKAKSYEKKGNVDKAKKLYCLILEHFPQNLSAKNALRKLNLINTKKSQSVSQQDIDEVVKLYSAGVYSEALDAANRILAREGPSAQLHNIIGVTLKALDKNTEAISHYRCAININPHFPEAYNNLGNALKDACQLEDAILCFKRSIELNPSSALPYSNLGDTLRLNKQTKEAINSCLQAIKIDPFYASAHFNLGNSYLDREDFESARECYSKSLILNPNYPEAHNNLGLALSKQEENMLAKSHLLRALELKPAYADANYNYGNLLSKVGDQNTAIRYYNQAITIKPDYYQALNALGNSHRAIGNSKEAKDCFVRALEVNPEYATSIYNLMLAQKYRGNIKYLEEIHQLLNNPNGSDKDCIYLYFALSKAYEDLGHREKCIKFLELGNKLESQTIEYEFSNDKILIENIKRIFRANSAVYSYNLEMPTLEKTPIFIVGMPRSGTTLVEQIISSHSKVYGAGELNILGSYASPLMRKYLSLNGSKIPAFSEEIINSVRKHYANSIATLDISEDIVTDKMPTNFIWIGFILSALPEAKILHLNRDPMATCWSIYKRLFTSAGNRFAYNLDTLGDFYKLYRDLMEFWREQFPGKIYDVDYEKLTQNQETETRKLLAHCELEWQQQCLEFHKAERAVKTASVDQVRKKMYTGSSEAWKDYEQYLEPLIDKVKNYI